MHSVPEPAPPGRARTTAWALAFGLLAVLALGLFVRPVADGDFWWHLAAGRHIAATGQVPSVDPTGMYAVRADNAYWAITVLQGQWLGQLAIHAAWQAAGLDGVVALRAALLATCLLLAGGRLRLAGAAPGASFAPMLVAALVLQAHGGERPQLFSFALFGAALALLDARRRVWRWALPPVLALWANLHPGVLLGAAIVTLWLLVEGLDDRRRAGHGATAGSGPWHSAAQAAACWLATLATPAGGRIHEYLLRLEADPLKGRVIEYQSPFALWGAADPLALVGSALLAAAAVPALVRLWRRRRAAEAAVLIATAALAASAWRYGPFFLLAAVPAIGRAASLPAEPAGHPAEHRPDPPPTPLRPSLRSVLPLAAPCIAVTLTALALAYGAGQGTLFRSGLAPARQPVALAAMLAARGATGRLFNHLSWGGYLQWTLGPGVVPFLDGRLLEPDRVQPYTHMLWATPEGRAAFDAAGFSWVLVPRVNPANPGQGRYRLLEWLGAHPGWALQAADSTGVLFVRR